MLKMMISTLALVLVTGVAQAQSSGANLKAVHAGGAPGTVGAMETAVYGLATSPQDVALQQSGRSVAAEGAQPIQHRAAPVGYSAGTVGAAPGQAR